tara:strand:+ start:57 stop:521 length:465 start_codon:yes stop_codon:yes gene_type:complete
MSKKDQSLFELGRKLDDSIDGLSKRDLALHLEGLCYSMEEGDYTKRLNSDEISERKSRLADVSIQISKLEQEKKDLMDEMKGRVDPVKKDLKELIEVIKSKSVSKSGRLFLFDDAEKGMMYKFDETGVCVDQRPLTPEERQQKLRAEMKLRRAE